MGNYLCGLMVLLGGAVMDGDDFYRFLVSGLFSLIIDIPPPPRGRFPLLEELWALRHSGTFHRCS